jgi:hypothetical protein
VNLRNLKFNVLIAATVLILLLGIIFGSVLSLIKVGDRSWVPAAIDKSKQLLRITKSYSKEEFIPISSSRYQLNPIYQIPKVGIFQLAYDDESNTIFAVDRFSGNFYSMDLDLKFKLKFITNLYDNLGIDKIRYPNELPMAMDLHFSDQFIYLSVVVPGLKNQCEMLKLYKLDYSDGAFNENKVGVRKKSIFQTPCITDRDNSAMWGGRIATSTDRIFFSVGDQRYDKSGFQKTDVLSKFEQSKTESVFGKILEISKEGNSSKIFSSGHRNAQGLYFSPEDNLLFESEHGPNGGDEINILRQDRNYGWPYVTFGKPYPKKYPSGADERNKANNPAEGVDIELRKFGAISGSHSGYQYPLFSWSPGVGAGNLIKISKNSVLTEWQNNILVAFMGSQAFTRVVLDPTNKVVFTEFIDLKFRIRDFILTKDGLIVISTDDGRFLILSTYESRKIS